MRTERTGSRLVVFVAGLALAGLAIFRAPAATPSRPPGLGAVVDHLLSEGRELTAVDLQHGAGPAAVSVERIWAGGETANTHLGVGWADPNTMRLLRIGADRATILRGGLGWRVLGRSEDRPGLQTSSGEILEEAGEGWTFRTADSVALTFDRNGRVTSRQPPVGPAWTWHYEGDGRLASLQRGEQDLLQYN